jgi:hypothetical protein
VIRRWLARRARGTQYVRSAYTQAVRPAAQREGRSPVLARLVLALVCLNAPALARERIADAESDLMRAGLVRGAAPDRSCVAPTLVVSGNLDSATVRELGDREVLPHEQIRREWKGQRVRYEAVSRGEWGGTISAVLPSGEVRVVIEDHARAFIPSGQVRSRLYVFAGLSHLVASDGAVYAIDAYDSDPKVSRITLLPQTPDLVLRNSEYSHRDRFWILGRSAIMEFLQDRSFSALQRERILMIGMCGAVAVVNVGILEGSEHSSRRAVTYFVPASRSMK